MTKKFKYSKFYSNSEAVPKTYARGFLLTVQISKHKKIALVRHSIQLKLGGASVTPDHSLEASLPFLSIKRTTSSPSIVSCNSRSTKSSKMDIQTAPEESTRPTTKPASIDATLKKVVEILSRQESSLYGIHNRLLTNEESSALLHQVKLLQEIHSQLAGKSTRLEFIWNAVLQTVIVMIAFLFGMFSIFSWHGQYLANQWISQANQISLMALCLASNAVSAVP